MTYLLEGLKVVDLASFLAAPGAATLMADYGAEVIKIEPISDDTYAATLGLPRPMVEDLRLLYMRLISRN